ncbi:MAG TPA: DM13 domain-containing protein [Candidatus Nitrosotenuis sp.]|jgi:hypothetical protein
MNKKMLIAAIIVGIGVPITVYAASPLFINTTIDEPLPTNIMKTDEKMMEEKMEKEMTEEKAMLKDEMMESEAMLEEEMTEEMIKEKMMDKESVMETQTMEEEMMEKTMEETMMEKQTTQSSDSEDFSAKSGVFVGVGDGIHDAQGNALVIPLENGQKVLRLEDFRSTNGPDLYVYLATDSGASDYVSLGRLKANIGNQNYDIPAGTDLSKYDNVLIWCKQFSVLFGSAELA